MFRLSRPLGVFAAASLALALCAPSEAKACGGGEFWQVSAGESVAATGHRVVISVSKTQTVLWDQLKFTGDPADFAWVYPAKPGAVVEAATDAWTESVDAVTTKRIQSPTVECFTGGGDSSGSGCGCGSAGADRAGGNFDQAGGDQNTDVTVVHSGTTGPYDTVTIKSDVPGAIGKWLTDNGYNVPAEVSPILDEYAAAGFDFIALRLTPDKGVDQMKPVRVVTPGPTMTFPMKMLSAGAADKVALDVMVLSEGRVQVDGFANTEVDTSLLSWDFEADTSNYASLRDAELAKDGGAVFLTTYALNGAAFGKADLGETAADSGAGPTDGTLAKTFFDAAVKNGEGKGCDTALLASLWDPLNSGNPEKDYLVVDVCDDQGTCTEPGANELDSRDLECGDAKDLAVAMVGMHPKDVWITRLEANLPKSALSQDLVLSPLQAGSDVVHGLVVAPHSTGDACGTAAAAPASPAETPRPTPPLPPSALGMIAAGLALALATLRRRLGHRDRATA